MDASPKAVRGYSQLYGRFTEAGVARSKVSKRSVGFEWVASDITKRCSKCSHYLGGGQCQLVRGHVSVVSWCSLYQKGRQ